MKKIFDYFDGVKIQFLRKKFEVGEVVTIPIFLAQDMKTFFNTEFELIDVKVDDFICNTIVDTFNNPETFMPYQIVKDITLSFSNNLEIEMTKHYPEHVI